MNKLVAILVIHYVSGDYWTDREAFIKKEESTVLGSNIKLSPKEESVNALLMKYKIEEYEAGFKNPSKFNPARHFFQAREDIEASQVFKIIKSMPKGAVLHVHDMYAISQEYFVNLTYRDNVYGCQIDNELYLKFLNETQENFCNWTSVSNLRKGNPSFDTYLKTQFFLNVPNPREVYPDINAIWKKTNKLFEKYSMFFNYKPVFQEQFYQSLQELYEDNVRYCEIRTRLSGVYDLDGRVLSRLEIASLYVETLERFKQTHDFLGARLIYQRRRSVPYIETEDQDLQLLNELHQTYPNFFAGFDIAGQEDLGKPLRHFVDFIKRVPINIKRFFHAGETNWYGETDLNLVDAVLLNTTRIGHGFGLIKHPLVLKAVREHRTAVEVSPISNQVLKLVEDLRNHPAVFLLADNYPVVIGSDNPILWGASGLSYDFYMVLMGMTSKNADLRVLKQLAINSFLYSSMPPLDKLDAIKRWMKDWETFVDLIIAEVNLSNKQ